MNLDNIKLPAQVITKHLTRLYYGKYMYKLILEIDRSKLVKSENRTQWYRAYPYYPNRLSLVNQLVTDIKSSVTNNDYMIRAESMKVGFFTNDGNDVTALIEKMPNRVHTLEKPVNANHADVVNQYRKVLVRNSLFEKEYKFKIYMRNDYRYRENRFSALREYLENSQMDWKVNSNLRLFFESRIHPNKLGWTSAVYLKTADDLMMFQLRFNDDIWKIEEAMLVSEL